MLRGVHSHLAFAQCGSAFGAHHQIGIRIDDGFAFQIGALEFVAVAYGRWT